MGTASRKGPSPWPGAIRLRDNKLPRHGAGAEMMECVGPRRRRCDAAKQNAIFALKELCHL